MSFCLFKLVKNNQHDENIFLNFLIEIQFCSANKLSKVVSPVYKAMVEVLIRNNFFQQLRLTRHLKSEHFRNDRLPAINREKFAHHDLHKFPNIAHASNFEKTGKLDRDFFPSIKPVQQKNQSLLVTTAQPCKQTKLMEQFYQHSSTTREYQYPKINFKDWFNTTTDCVPRSKSEALQFSHKFLGSARTSVRKFDRHITYSYPAHLFETRITVGRSIYLCMNILVLRPKDGLLPSQQRHVSSCMSFCLFKLVKNK